MCCGPAIQPGLIGNWRMTLVEGGIAGRVINVPADSAVILTFSSDSTYRVQHGFSVGESGTFHVTDTPVFSIPQPVIVFSSGIVPLGIQPQVYRISRDTLFLGEDFDDGFQSVYLKIN